MKTWTKEEIKDLLLRNDKAVCRGLIALWNFQTLEEQVSQSTRNNNGIGFNGLDAPILSSFVEWYNKNGYLSPKQLGIARKKIIKYAGQLMNIANENEKKGE